MKRIQKIRCFLLFGLLMLPTLIYSQDVFSKFSLSGFDVKLIPSDRYAIEVNETFEFKKEVIDGDILYIQVLDQTGAAPKSSITIYTNELCYLELHNCKLTTETPINTDSLAITLSSSFGSLAIKSKLLTINAGGGTSFTVEGSTEYLACNVGGASNVSASKLLAEQAEIDVMGYSSLIANAKTISKQSCEKSTFKNVYSK